MCLSQGWGRCGTLAPSGWGRRGWWRKYCQGQERCQSFCGDLQAVSLGRGLAGTWNEEPHPWSGGTALHLGDKGE